MAQREGSVYLWLFIASFVLFVGMVVLFFVDNADKNKIISELMAARKEATTERARAEKNSTERDELRKLVGGQEAAAAWPGDEHYKTKLKEAQDFLNDQFKKLDQRAPKEYNDMLIAYTDYKDLVTKILDTRQRAQESLKRSEEDKVELMKSNKEEVQKKDELVAGLKTQITETEARYEKKISELTRDSERLQKELATVKDEMASAEIRANRADQFSKSMIASLQLRLEQLTAEVKKTKGIEDVEPDGRILQVVSTSQIGWIDIGRKQHLRPGLDFLVFQNVKGGKRQYKGKVEVRRVDEGTSEFRIVDTTDELNPITQGDYVTSPFYDPRAVPVFVFAGEGLESKDVTEEALRAKIKSYGAQIRGEVDLKTSFLIALKDYEKSPHYKTARELGVAVLRERDILQYMGL